MDEIWRDIEDYEGLYQVSDLGRVRSLDHYAKSKGGSLHFVKGRILKGTKYKNGYLCVMLCKNGIAKHHYIHRLAGEAFIPNPDNLPEIDHINRIRTDNRLENLRWADDRLQYDNSGTRKSLSKPVLQYTLDMEFVAEYPSTAEAERQTGINNSKICQVCKGKRKSAGGYIWKYKELNADMVA